MSIGRDTVQRMRLARTARRATLSRSIRLFRLFLLEQTDPAVFYAAFAEDSVQTLSTITRLNNRTVLDVGGGPGYFSRAFASAGARYIGLDVDEPADVSAEAYSVRGSGVNLPFRSGSVDITYSSNVLEHISDGRRLLAELVRVTRPSGIVFISFTPWFSPWGGHETSPWHYLGGRFASRLFQRRRGRRPKNDYGRTLFAYRVGEVRRWIRDLPDAELIRTFPRYHPRGTWWIAMVPGLREFATWNVVFVLARVDGKPASGPGLPASDAPELRGRSSRH